MRVMKNEKKSSIPYDIVSMQANICNRFFTICMVLIIILVVETCYIIYIKSDIGTYETTETVDMDAENGTNNNFNYVGGDNNGSNANN